MMTILYTDIFTTCQDLSSYEASRIKDGSGRTMYAEIHITEQDEMVVHRYIELACVELAEKLRNATEGILANGTSVELSFIDEKTRIIPTADTLEHTIASYVMAMWLQDKAAERSESYRLIGENMVQAVRRSIARKRPKLNANM